MATSSLSLHFLKRSASLYTSQICACKCKVLHQMPVSIPPKPWTIWCKYPAGAGLVVTQPENPTSPSKDPGQVPDVETPSKTVSQPEIPTSPSKHPGRLPEIEISPPMPELPPEPSEPGREPEFPRPPLPPPEVPDTPLPPPDLVPPEMPVSDVVPPLHPPEIKPPRLPEIDPPRPAGPGPGAIVFITNLMD